MSKKRTTIPFYGKNEQRLEQKASMAFKAGNTELGNACMNTVSHNLAIKRVAHAARR